MILRLALSRSAGEIDRRLDQRVCGSRLAKPGPAWQLREPRPAFRSYRERAENAVEDGVTEMLQLDVANYFPSVAVDVLSTSLSAWPIKPDDAARVTSILKSWQANGDVDGLPIGPQGSALIGTSLLEVIDDAFVRANLDFARYMDDARAFGHAGVDWAAVQDVVSDALSELGLTLSAKKTFVVEGRASIVRAVRRTSTSLGGCITRGDEAGLHRWADAILATDTANIDLADFHSILTALGNKQDVHAVPLLLRAPDVMHLDPKSVGEYFEKAGAGKGFGEEIFTLLSAAVVSPDLEVQLLRTLQHAQQGATEKQLLLSIAEDAARLPPQRAWALTVMRESEARSRTAAHAALSDADFLVRRAGVLALKGSKRHQSLLRDVQRSETSLAVPATYALSA